MNFTHHRESISSWLIWRLMMLMHPRVLIVMPAHHFGCHKTWKFPTSGTIFHNKSLGTSRAFSFAEPESDVGVFSNGSKGCRIEGISRIFQQRLGWLPHWTSGDQEVETHLELSKVHRIHVWYIYLHEWLIFMVNVGKYTSPMDPMGMFLLHLSDFFWKCIHAWLSWSPLWIKKPWDFELESNWKLEINIWTHQIRLYKVGPYQL